MTIDNIKDLKQAIKIDLEKTRAPKNIDTFWVFKMIYESTDVNSDQDVFVSTAGLFNMGIQSSVMQPYFNNYIGQWDNPNWSFGGYKCRTIKSWSPKFIELMERTKDLQVPDYIKETYLKKQTAIGDNLDDLKESWSKVSDKDMDENYVSTSASPFRKYHALQTVKKSERDEVFEGKYDVDLSKAHTAIAFHELDMKNCDLPMSWALNPDFSDVLIDKIKTDFDCDDEKAKDIRCSLTSTKKNSYGVKWFDDLGWEIQRRAENQYKSVKFEGRRVLVNTLHKYFTFVEQEIMNKLSSQNDIDEVLRMHDGLISKTKPVNNHIEFNGNIYPLKIQKFGA